MNALGKQEKWKVGGGIWAIAPKKDGAGRIPSLALSFCHRQFN
jgi:hypothetical protein